MSHKILWVKNCDGMDLDNSYGNIFTLVRERDISHIIFEWKAGAAPSPIIKDIISEVSNLVEGIDVVCDPACYPIEWWESLMQSLAKDVMFTIVSNCDMLSKYAETVKLYKSVELARDKTYCVPQSYYFSPLCIFNTDNAEKYRQLMQRDSLRFKDMWEHTFYRWTEGLPYEDRVDIKKMLGPWVKSSRYRENVRSSDMVLDYSVISDGIQVRPKIPKIIHRVWFGGEMPDYVKHCRKTQDLCFKGWKIMDWNESNCDLDVNEYTRKMYDVGLYAFASEYFRFYNLQKYGGVYIDSDIEVLKPFDMLLWNNMFLSRQRDVSHNFRDNDSAGVHDGIVGATPNHPVVTNILSWLDKRDIHTRSGNKTRTVPQALGEVIWDSLYEIEGNRDIQCQEDLFYRNKYLTLYPSDYLCPTRDITSSREKYLTSDNTYCIHRCQGQWMDIGEALIRQGVL